MVINPLVLQLPGNIRLVLVTHLFSTGTFLTDKLRLEKVLKVPKQGGECPIRATPGRNNLMTPLGFGTTRLTTNGITDWEQAAFQSNTGADGVRLQQLLSNMDLGLFLFSAAINFNRMNLRYRFFFFCWLEWMLCQGNVRKLVKMILYSFSEPVAWGLSVSYCSHAHSIWEIQFEVI